MEYEDFKKVLKENNLTIKEFASLANISYRTCNGWSKPSVKVPNWVKPFLDLYVKKNQLQKEVDRHIAFKQEFYEMMNGQTITVR
jgi:DNA-binding transcriptional regulator YiaG